MLDVLLSRMETHNWKMRDNQMMDGQRLRLLNFAYCLSFNKKWPFVVHKIFQLGAWIGTTLLWMRNFKALISS
jgi:hypothetical protein